MPTESERESVIRVALRLLNRAGWSTESGKNSTGFVLTNASGERLLVVGHGRWNLNSSEHNELYGQLLRLYSQYPDASRGALILPVSAGQYIDAVSKQVRDALGLELAIVDPAAGTMQWLGQTVLEPDFIDLDGRESPSAPRGGVLSRLRRLFT